MTNARECALNVLEKVFDDNAYSNIVLNEVLNKSNLDEKDRALTTEIVYGTIKYKYTIDRVLSNFLREGLQSVSSTILNILRSAIYQLKYLDRVPEFAVVNEAVNIAKVHCKGYEKLVNGVLRSYLRSTKTNYITTDDYIQDLCYKYSFEEWMVNLFILQYGKEKCEHILMGLNCNPNVTVRVNNLKDNFDNVWNKLQSLGYDIKEGYICPEAISILKGSNIRSNNLFEEGFITVQDESAMLIAPSMDISPNMKCLDLCAAPGGKATHMSDIMNNTGYILACDVYPSKIKLINNNCSRLGVTNIETRIMNAEKLEKELINSFDRVLIDVPCSGLGIIRKKPEIKWRKINNDILNIIEIQRNILINSSNYVKDGGILLYSTCTLNKSENEENIDWFIANNSNFKVEPLYFGDVKNIMYSDKGYVTVLPDEHMDGFFIAKLRKQ